MSQRIIQHLAILANQAARTSEVLKSMPGAPALEIWLRVQQRSLMDRMRNEEL